MACCSEVLFVVAAIQFDGGVKFTKDWVKPFGNMFINLLKLIAVPLILASLVKGVSDLKDISKLSKMGLRAITFYLFTTVFAVSLGLAAVNIVKPLLMVIRQMKNQQKLTNKKILVH